MHVAFGRVRRKTSPAVVGDPVRKAGGRDPR